VADLEGGSGSPFSTEICHQMLVKLKIWDSKCFAILGVGPPFWRPLPPFYSKFLDPPLQVVFSLPTILWTSRQFCAVI
jgi:hypothetical protein